MAEQIIRDFYGKIIAKIETKPNGDKTIRDFYGRILGKYDAATNTTRDFYGRMPDNAYREVSISPARL